MEFIKEWGMIAGLAGLALGGFVYLFREIIQIKIFRTLNQKQSYNILIVFMVMVWLLSAYSITIYFINGNQEGSIQLTVYVHGSKGPQDIVLENRGELIVDFDNDRRTVQIGEDGRTNFGEIPEKFVNEIIGIGVDAPGYESSNPTKVYKMDGKPIYFPVKRAENLLKISGFVKSRDGIRLENALVSIGTDTTIKSNESGIFKIVLPEHMGLKNGMEYYSISVEKEGYISETTYYYPLSGDIEFQLTSIGENI